MRVMKKYLLFTVKIVGFTPLNKLKIILLMFLVSTQLQCYAQDTLSTSIYIYDTHGFYFDVTSDCKLSVATSVYDEFEPLILNGKDSMYSIPYKNDSSIFVKVTASDGTTRTTKIFPENLYDGKVNVYIAESGYYHFENYTCLPYNPKWNSFYVEFAFSERYDELGLTKEERQQYFEKELKSIGVQRKLIGLASQHCLHLHDETSLDSTEVLSNLRKSDLVRSVEVIASTGAPVEFFMREATVVFVDSVDNTQINELLGYLNLESYHQDLVEGLTRYTIEFSTDQMFSYDFLKILDQLFLNPIVHKVRTFKGQGLPVAPNK